MNLDVDVASLKLSNGKTVEQQLIVEINRLKSLLQKEIDDWYSAYSPVRYSRTYGMRDSISVDDVCTIDTESITVNLNYDNRAYHKSLWENTQVNVLLLMNSGYHVKSGWHKNIPYFGYREAGQFLDKAIETFNRSNYFGFKASINENIPLYV